MKPRRMIVAVLTGILTIGLVASVTPASMAAPPAAAPPGSVVTVPSPATGTRASGTTEAAEAQPVALHPSGQGDAADSSATAVDTTPPTPPGKPTASGLTCKQVTLAWAASTDAVGVTAYDLYHDGQQVLTVAGATRQATVAVVEGVTWGWYVNARDAAGNVSQASPTLTVTPPRCVADTTPPLTPRGLAATATGTSIRLTWNASSDNLGIAGYDVRREGAVVGSVLGHVLTFTDAGLQPGRTYLYSVVARDSAGNRSAPSAGARATTTSTCATPVCGATRVMTDKDIPWGLTTLPDGNILYARRDTHEIVRLNPDTGVKSMVGRLRDASGTDGEGGVMGITIASDFAADPWVYIMYTTATDNRVVRVRYTSARMLDLSTMQVLLPGILRNKYHNGGRLRFGPDGMLYVATGDAQNESYSQVLTGTGALNGKILRMTRTGGIPADNPFGTYIWSYGHRNPQGLAFDAQGRLWQQEFGNSLMDETNLVVKGGNYGWPQCEGTGRSGCGQPGLVAPKFTYPTAEGSCSGIAVVGNALYVACARGQRLYRLEISGTSLVNPQQYFVGTYGRFRTVEPAPGGDLWLTTTNLGDKDSVGNNSDERILRIDLR